MKYLIILFPLIVLFSFQGCAQNNLKKNVKKKGEIKTGGSCEGCQAIYETTIPFEKLDWTDTLPDFNDPGPQLVVSGIIYKKDGKTPAPGVVLYVYHTDQKGIYPSRGYEKGRAGQHGFIRGWIKSNDRGQYKFYTLVPASYPNSSNPKHIHSVIKEPGLSEYWIDDFVFADDPLLPEGEQNKTQARGGSGVLKTYMKNGMLHAERNIILGKNIPGYPAK